MPRSAGTKVLDSGCHVQLDYKGEPVFGGPTRRPRTYYEGQVWQTARLVYNLKCEPIPRNPPNRKVGLVLHTCDNGWCVNSAHLELGTCAKNRKDAHDRGLWVYTPEILAKRSVSAKGRKASEEARRKMSDAAKLRCTPEWRSTKAAQSKAQAQPRRAEDGRFYSMGG